MIRPATPADIPAILAIWNPLIADTTITFSPTLQTAESVAAMLSSRPLFLVADEGGVQGFVTCDQFRKGAGYAHAMEHTILLAPGGRGRGLGRALITALEDRARAAGGHVLVGAVSGENDRGLAFHRAVGFTEAGRIREAGFKFGRWIDLVLMQKPI